MHINYPELLVPGVIGLVCVVYVLPWHIRVRNLATLSMAFWMISSNLVHIINRKFTRTFSRTRSQYSPLTRPCVISALIWNEGVENKAPVWCDISTFEGFVSQNEF